MIVPGKHKVIPGVPDDMREAVIMAIRIMEGQSGKNVELAGAVPAGNNTFDIKYRTKKFTQVEEVQQKQAEIESWIKENPERLKEALEFLKSLAGPLLKVAQKMGFKK